MAELEVVTPVDGTVYARRRLASWEEVSAVLERAARAARSWREVPLSERIAILSRFADLLEARAEELAPELSWQMGRPILFAPRELRTAADRARRMIELAPAALADRPVSGDRGLELFIRREPLGVVLVLPAWNYPYLIAINSIAPALLAGDAVVLKHSSQTPLCAERFAELLEGSGLPADVFLIFHAAHAETERAVADERVGFVAFTGSVAGGHEIVRAAADRFVGCGLELGGKDPAYVRADADLEDAVEQLADGAFFNSGQSCCGIERIYVHRRVAAAFVEGLVERARRYRLGSPLDPEVDLGPVARRAHADFVRGEIRSALAAGARALVPEADFPGARPGTPYLAPQILVGVHHSMSIMREETFGPVVGVMEVADDEEAIERMNDSRYGLTASVWTRDRDAALAIGSRIETGTFFLNRCDWLEPALPWVGVKDSGRGCSLSALGFDQITRPKSFHLRPRASTSAQGAGANPPR